MEATKPNTTLLVGVLRRHGLKGHLVAKYMAKHWIMPTMLFHSEVTIFDQEQLTRYAVGPGSVSNAPPVVPLEEYPHLPASMSALAATALLRRQDFCHAHVTVMHNQMCLQDAVAPLALRA